MSVIKTIKTKIGVVNILDDDVPESNELYKINLQDFYDTMNNIANNITDSNINIDNLFYSTEALSKIDVNDFVIIQ
jgi:hypothetical protein